MINPFEHGRWEGHDLFVFDPPLEVVDQVGATNVVHRVDFTDCPLPPGMTREDLLWWAANPDRVMPDDMSVCELCGLVGQHRHRPHATEVRGAIDDGRAVTLRLAGCIACGELDVAGDELCPSFIARGERGAAQTSTSGAERGDA